MLIVGPGLGVPRDKPKTVQKDQPDRRIIEKFNNTTVKDIIECIDDWSCRWEAQRLVSETGVQAVSLSFPSILIDELLAATNTRSGDVLRVVLNEMPQPSDTTSLEQVLQFRQDPESNKKMLALHRCERSIGMRSSGGAGVADSAI